MPGTKPCEWLRRISRPSVVVTCWLGLAFLFSGPDRLSAEAYRGIVATGGAYVWGTVFLVVSACLIYGANHSTRLMRYSYILSGVAFLLLTFTFTYAAVRFSVANFTAPAAYGGLAYLHFFIAHELTKPENLRRRHDHDNCDG